MSQTASTAPETKPGKGLRKPPGPSSLTLFSNAYALGRDPMRLSLGLWRQYGDIVHFPVLSFQAYVLYHPDQVKHVLQENHRNYDKQFPMMKAFRSSSVFGNGLFTSDGEPWLRQRRLMQPSFHRERLNGFTQIMTEATLAMLERWQQRSPADAPLDIPLEMMRLTQRIVGLTLFSLDLSDDVDVVGRTFTNIGTALAKYASLPFPPLWMPTPGNRRLQTGLNLLNSIVDGIIQERRRHSEGAPTKDLLGMLLAAQVEETGAGMSDQQVRDEVWTLLLAGYETTAVTLTWIWYLLSQHPEAEYRLHEELETVLADQVPTVAHLDALPSTRMVVQETLRLCPPSFGMTRHTVADDEIGGYHIPANSMVFLTQYATHRHPAFWEEPEVFDPGRFSEERSAGRPRYAYFPFGGGPRQCIGNTFALMEAQLVLATVARHFTLRLVPGHPVEPSIQLTLRPKYGLPMTLQRR